MNSHNDLHLENIENRMALHSRENHAVMWGMYEVESLKFNV